MTDSRFEIPSFGDLLSSLPMEFRSQKVRDQLNWAFQREKEIIETYVKRLTEDDKAFSAVMLTFSKGGGSQWIADFAVKDLTILEGNKFNWHLQNVSQWVYAGCILFDERSFKDDSEWIISTHH